MGMKGDETPHHLIIFCKPIFLIYFTCTGPLLDAQTEEWMNQ